MTTAEKILRAKADIDAVYEAGKAQGGDSYYDTFWDAYQDNGTRKIYNYAFAGWGWYDNIFKPKHPFPKFSYCNYMFASNSLTKIPYVLDLTEVTLASGKRNVASLFNGATNLVEIQEIKVNEEVAYNACFNNCNQLEEVRFTGTIAQNGLNFQWCTKLTNASLKSILTALTKDETLATGKTCTLAKNHEAVIQADTELEDLYDSSLSSGWKFVFS